MQTSGIDEGQWQAWLQANGFVPYAHAKNEAGFWVVTGRRTGWGKLVSEVYHRSGDAARSRYEMRRVAAKLTEGGVSSRPQINAAWYVFLEVGESPELARALAAVAAPEPAPEATDVSLAETGEAEPMGEGLPG